MNEKEVNSLIKTCLKEVKGNHFDYEKDLISGGFISSIEFFSLLLKLEKTFQIKFPLENILPENFDSIGDIERQIRGLL